MDPPLINESSFSAANPSAYSLAEIWPVCPEPGSSSLGLRMSNLGQSLSGFTETSINQDGSVEESTITEQSAGGSGARGSGRRCGSKRADVSSVDDSLKLLSTCSANDPKGKRIKLAGSIGSKSEMETCSAAGDKSNEQSTKTSEPCKPDYIHVRARRGQATDSHSLAERARREKISERMKLLQDLVPGCNKVVGKALVLDEIINYVQSLQSQVEFLSMKLEAVNSRMHITHANEGFPSKDIASPSFGGSGMILASQALRGYVEGHQPELLHLHLAGSFERAT